MKNGFKNTFAGLSLAFFCLIAASCYFGIDDDFLEIPFNPEWGELLIDGAPQTPVDGFMRIEKSPAARVFEFRPNAAQGWSFNGWFGMEPNPFPIADVPYGKTRLSTENPFTLVIDEAFVSTYAYLAPKAERFDIMDALVNPRGESAFITQYPDGSRKTFIMDPSGADALDVTALIGFPGEYRLLAFSDSSLIAWSFNPESGIGALDTATGAWRSLIEATDDSGEFASPGGKLVGRSTGWEEGQNGTVEILDADSGTLLYSRDFLSEAGRIVLWDLTDTRLFYIRVPADPGAGDEIRSIDIASGTDAGIPLGKDYRGCFATPVAGSGSLALLCGSSFTGDGVINGDDTDYFLFDPDAGTPHPLKSGGLASMSDPVYAGANRIYARVNFASTAEYGNVIWDYVADTFAECPIGGSILRSGPEGVYSMASIDPVITSGYPNYPYGELILHRSDGTESDLTPYAAILQ